MASIASDLGLVYILTNRPITIRDWAQFTIATVGPGDSVITLQLKIPQWLFTAWLNRRNSTDVSPQTTTNPLVHISKQGIFHYSKAKLVYSTLNSLKLHNFPERL